MGVRLQPPAIEIPEGDPFQHDLLDREDTAEILTRVVSNIDGPCAIAVDAPWGAGKTTFLKMWAQLLRDSGFLVTEFNAWETDYSGDPFVAMSSEIIGAIQKWPAQSSNGQLEAAKTASLEILRKAAPGVIRFAAGFIPFAGGEIGNVLSSMAEEKIAGYQKAQNSITEFKSQLQTLADMLWESNGNRPLVVLIDELDRCRPSYAIELLEIGKHIFSVDHVVFVIAVNRSELAKSIKALYGDEFGADGYLRRFFDADFRLPEPDRDAFIREMLVSGGFYEFLGLTRDHFAVRDGGFVLTVLRAFLGVSDVSLREVGQAIHRFGLVVSSLSAGERAYCLTLAVLTILLAIDPSLYRRFVDGEMTDQEVVDSFFSKPGYQAIRRTPSGFAVEAVLIAAGVTERDLRFRREDLREIAPLYWEYSQSANADHTQVLNLDIEPGHALEITDLIWNLLQMRGPVTDALGLTESAERLELLSADLNANDREP